MRSRCVFPFVLLLVVTVGVFGSYPGRCAPLPVTSVVNVTERPSFLEQVVTELHGVPIANASAKDLIKAVKKVIAKNRKEAAAVLADVLPVERPDMQEIAGQLVAAAIDGLGKDATAVEVEDLVREAIDLQPKALLSIVQSSVEAVSSCEMVSSIVDTASENRPASDGKNVVALEGKDVVPLDGKNIVAVDGKTTVPLSPASVAVSDSKDVAPPDGKQVAAPANAEVAPENNDIVSQIAQAAFNARPDCDPKGLASRPGPLGDHSKSSSMPGLGTDPTGPSTHGKGPRGNPGAGTVPSP